VYSKLWLVFALLLLGLLAGCEGIEVEGASHTSIVVSPSTSPTTLQTPPSPEVAITSTDIATPSPTSTPTPEPTPTLAPSPTPFLCPYLRGRTESGSLVSATMREEVRYLVHLPPCYDAYPDKAFPVLYMLHGWPLDERHWITLGIDELVDDWTSREIIGPFIVVLPGVSSDGLYVNSSGGPWSFEGMFVDELLPVIEQTYRTWREPAARAIGGISRGGVWSLEIALRHQDRFSIMGGHSPALSLNRPMPQYDPFLLAKKGVTGMRIYLDAGNLDWARASTLQFYDVLVEQGADVTYQVHEGGHVDALWRRGLPDYIDFYTLTWPRSYTALPLWQPEPAAPTP
jgi:enterochelin esterase-like enzyme